MINSFPTFTNFYIIEISLLLFYIPLFSLNILLKYFVLSLRSLCSDSVQWLFCILLCHHAVSVQCSPSTKGCAAADHAAYIHFYVCKLFPKINF